MITRSVTHSRRGGTELDLAAKEFALLDQEGRAVPVSYRFLSTYSTDGMLAVYAEPTFDAVAAATAALDPHRRH